MWARMRRHGDSVGQRAGRRSVVRRQLIRGRISAAASDAPSAEPAPRRRHQHLPARPSPTGKLVPSTARCRLPPASRLPPPPPHRLDAALSGLQLRLRASPS